MFKMIAIRNNETVENKYSEYFQALTTAIQLQNAGYVVTITKE